MSKADPVVHVIDDDEAVRNSLAFLLDMADLPARTYASAEAFLDEAAETVGGCVVTDIRMPGMSGLDLARALKARGAQTPVIVMTGHGDLPMAIEAMRAGVIDFLEKPFEEDALIGAIRSALAAGNRDQGNDAEKQRFSEVLGTLSGRERDVMRGVVDGKLNKVIAYELGISPRTVEVYRANVMTKTGAHSLSELVRMALIAGF